MRADGVFRLILNIKLFRGMKFEVPDSQRFLKFATFEDKRLTQYTIRVRDITKFAAEPSHSTRQFANNKAAQDMLETIEAYYPGAQEICGAV